MNWQNDITEIARLKEKVKKLEVTLNYANTHLEAERNYRERLEYTFSKEKHEALKKVMRCNAKIQQENNTIRKMLRSILCETKYDVSFIFEKDGEQNDRNGMPNHCRDCICCSDCFNSFNNSVGEGEK